MDMAILPARIFLTTCSDDTIFLSETSQLRSGHRGGRSPSGNPGGILATVIGSQLASRSAFARRHDERVLARREPAITINGPIPTAFDLAEVGSGEK
jgi:hypothetical protein